MRRLAVLLAVVTAAGWGCDAEKADGPYVLYYDSGNKKEEGTHKNGELEGDFFQYYEDGTKKYVGFYEDGELKGSKLAFYEPFVTYFDASEGEKLRVEGTHKDGKREGAYAVYYGESAKKKVTGEYKNTNKHGTWIWYGKDGQKKQQRQWDSGELIHSQDCVEDPTACK
jgi:hypothetical protein